MFSCRFNPKQKKWEMLNEKKKVQRRVTTPEEADNIAGLLNAGLPLPRMRNRKPAAEAEQERLGLLAADQRDDAGPAQKRARQVCVRDNHGQVQTMGGPHCRSGSLLMP